MIWCWFGVQFPRDSTAHDWFTSYPNSWVFFSNSQRNILVSSMTSSRTWRQDKAFHLNRDLDRSFCISTKPNFYLCPIKTSIQYKRILRLDFKVRSEHLTDSTSNSRRRYVNRVLNWWRNINTGVIITTNYYSILSNTGTTNFLDQITF